jgi:RpiB/LacA/LacB family sugar-phosphate isomerase
MTGDVTPRAIIIGSDHAAVALRDHVAEGLRADGWHVEVVGPSNGDRVDYPGVAIPLGEAVASGRFPLGVLVCGTGIGVSIAANKVSGVRAALVHDPVTAELAARHNAANVLCLGGRIMAPEYGLLCVRAWLGTDFEARHQPRLDAISRYERARADAGET